VLERSGAAGRALECRSEPYAGGSGDYDSGLASTQDSAASALENHFSEEPFLQLPRDGYRLEREDDGRVLYSYDVRGRTKVAFIATDSMRDFKDDVGWGIGIPVAKIESYPGPDHCDWQNITFLTLDTESGERQYLRDTTGELRDFLATTFDDSSSVPKRATDTGFERDGRRLWLHPNGTAAYLVDKTNPEDVERWPAANEPVACA